MGRRDLWAFIALIATASSASGCAESTLHPARTLLIAPAVGAMDVPETNTPSQEERCTNVGDEAIDSSCESYLWRRDWRK